MILALLLIVSAQYPRFGQGQSRDGGVAWPVECTNCSSSGSSSVSATIDGGRLGSVGWIDGGYINATVTNFPSNLLTDGGVVNVGNFPASQAVTGAFWQATQPVLVDGGNIFVTNFPATQAISGTVSVSGYVPPDGGVAVTNFPTTQNVQQLPVTPWACGVNVIANQTLQCQAAPGAGVSLYLTDYSIWGVQDAGTTLTKGVAAIVWGTGTNCATLDGGIVPTIAGAATTMSIGFQANGGTIASQDFTTPVVAPSNTELCVKCSIPCVAQLNGFTR